MDVDHPVLPPGWNRQQLQKSCQANQVCAMLLAPVDQAIGKCLPVGKVTSPYHGGWYCRRLGSRSEATQVTVPASVPARSRSSRFCSEVPPPDKRTARRGRTGIMIVFKRTSPHDETKRGKQDAAHQHAHGQCQHPSDEDRPHRG